MVPGEILYNWKDQRTLLGKPSRQERVKEQFWGNLL